MTGIDTVLNQLDPFFLIILYLRLLFKKIPCAKFSAHSVGNSNRRVQRGCVSFIGNVKFRQHLTNKGTCPNFNFRFKIEFVFLAAMESVY